MSRLYFLVAAVLCFVAAASKSDVVELTSSNFDSVVNGNDFVLVKFHAPWCGHCKSLAPEYIKAAAQLKGTGVVLAEVDATQERKLGEQYGVKGFPTLKFFRSGKATEYDGPRKADGIVSWINKKTGPAFATLSTVQELDDFKAKSDVVVVGVFGDSHLSEKAAFEKAAIASDSVQFGLANSEAVAAAAGVTAPAVVVFQKFDDGRADFSGSFDVDSISNFVNGNKLPLVVPFSNENSQEIFGSDVKVHTLIFVDNDAENYENILNAAKAVAKGYRGQSLFVTVASEHDRIMGFFGIQAGDVPTVRIVSMGQQIRKYKFDAESITQESLTSFLSSYFAGSLKPDLKSDEVPAAQTEAVYVVVGKSFDEVVLNSKKDVLVEFYAPWCGHCKSLAPVYEKLAKRLKSVESLVIAKMDATANEHEAVEVEGFPTLKLWRADDKANPVDFDGNRDEEGILSFLKENAAIPFTVSEEEEPEEGKDEL